MLFLVLTIVLTSLLFIIFKAFDRFSVNAFQAVVVNYLTCVVVGLLFSTGVDYKPFISDMSWLWWSCFMGVLFISTFYMMAWSAINISVSVSTLSSKLSLIIPVLISVFVLRTGEGSWLYVFGFALILLSIFLSVYSPVQTRSGGIKKLVFAILIFLMTGAVDASINIANHKFEDIIGFGKLFPISVFIMAFVFGSIALLKKVIIEKEKVEFRSVLGGVMLGIPNYFSIYYLMKTLSYFKGNGAMVFPVVNMSVIILCAILARILFNEKLNIVNVIGLVCGVISIALISL